MNGQRRGLAVGSVAGRILLERDADKKLVNRNDTHNETGSAIIGDGLSILEANSGQTDPKGCSVAGVQHNDGHQTDLRYVREKHGS